MHRSHDVSQQHTDQTTARWTYDRVQGARDAFGAVLAELDLDAYRFAIEPRGDHWEAQVEFATTYGWKTATVEVDDDNLLASLEEDGVRERLVESLSTSFMDAKRAASR